MQLIAQEHAGSWFRASQERNGSVQGEIMLGGKVAIFNMRTVFIFTSALWGRLIPRGYWEGVNSEKGNSDIAITNAKSSTPGISTQIIIIAAAAAQLIRSRSHSPQTYNCSHLCILAPKPSTTPFFHRPGSAVPVIVTSSFYIHDPVGISFSSSSFLP